MAKENPLTRYFYELLPQRIHEAFEQAGLRCQPAIRFLNSLENRVAQVQDEDGNRWVAKFYRPGRWSKAAILEEHAFLAELKAAGLPVVPPAKLREGGTVGSSAGIFFSIFPYVAGRPPDELERLHVDILGDILARLHNLGARKPARHRPVIEPATWGTRDLEILGKMGSVPPDIWPRYEKAVQRLVKRVTPAFEGLDYIRLHGDFHRGNLLWSREGAVLVDFDDMAMGPPVHDVWMVVPGRDPDAAALREILLESYEKKRRFNWKTLQLVEPLRALKFVHHAAWLAARRDDPAFRRLYGEVVSRTYWRNELSELEEQVQRIEYGG